MAGRPDARVVIRREILRHARLTRALRRIRGAIRHAGRRTGGTSAGPRRYPTDFQVHPAPPAIAGDWPEPPAIDSPFPALHEPAPPSDPIRHDLALFEQLNAEYAAKPVAPIAPRYDSASLSQRSRSRLTAVHDRIGLAGRTVLEVGCGAGYEVWFLAHHLGCDAWGIDISPRRAWPILAGGRVHLVEGDIATRGSLPANTFDRVISFTVWEHVTHPLEAITELERVMKPGGLAWVRANLYRGPTASHRTRDIRFPFPH
ncbi:MAG TPA: methyltransferase domain-containing protein, partial [Candidatus Limnocylindrales bacterium]|nr:methyltransferase domain-containing protein [Candidatus Limnocylindrales bacterium]